METYELRYFLGVAERENFHRAAEKMNVSTASLSKAVARLESELGVALFVRESRQIRLTEQGRLLQKRASEIVQLEESTRQELAGFNGEVQRVIAGPEVLLAQLGIRLANRLRELFPNSRIDLRACSEPEALGDVASGVAHFALISSELAADTPHAEDLFAKSLLDVKFQVAVGEGHALFHRKKLEVAELLQHGFVVPETSLLGRVGGRPSRDGWRDDKFPRRILYATSSLRTLESLVTSGKALAYLPDYLAIFDTAKVLKVEGCPYTCTQKIKLVARQPKRTPWMKELFSSF